MADNLPVVREESGELSITDLVAQVTKIQQAMKAVMHDGEHYGTIPGTPKPTLLKPGAEKLCLLFRLDPEYEIMSQTEEPTFIAFTIRCVLHHIPTGNRVASGMGSCTSREEKYGWRKSSRHCPKCGAGAIIKGKAEYGGGWLCFAKKGGCAAKFKDGDASIEDQKEERVPTENVWDQHNTLLKMACKRALVAAVLNGTAASDLFTQDLEDMPAFGGGQPPDAQGGRQSDERPKDAPRGGQQRQAAPAPSGGATGDERSKVMAEVIKLAGQYATAVKISSDEAVAEISGYDGKDGQRHEIATVEALRHPQKVSVKWLQAMRRRGTALVEEARKTSGDAAPSGDDAAAIRELDDIGFEPGSEG